MDDKKVKSDDNKKILYMDTTKLYGHSMSQPLPFDGTKFEKYVCLNDIINTPDDSDFDFFLEVDLTYSYNIGQKRNYFSFSPECKTISKDVCNDYMNKIQPKYYTEHKKKFVIGLTRKSIWFIIEC